MEAVTAAAVSTSSGAKSPTHQEIEKLEVFENLDSKTYDVVLPAGTRICSEL
jgi:hypothetical protein